MKIGKKIKKYANELSNALSTDLNKACAILTKIFKGVTVGEAIELLDELKECIENSSLIEDSFHSCSNIILKGTKPNEILDIVEHLEKEIEFLKKR